MTCTCKKSPDVLLFFSSATRDSGTLASPEFFVPEHVSEFDVSKLKCFIQVQRFHVASLASDTDLTFVLQLSSHSQMNSYDSVIAGTSSVIAVQPGSQVPGSYSNMREPLPKVQISPSPLGSVLKFHIATIDVQNGVVQYVDANRDAYFVLKCTFQE